jgi:hypothetical protein
MIVLVVSLINFQKYKLEISVVTTTRSHQMARCSHCYVEDKTGATLHSQIVAIILGAVNDMQKLVDLILVVVVQTKPLQGEYDVHYLWPSSSLLPLAVCSGSRLRTRISSSCSIPAHIHITQTPIKPPTRAFSRSLSPPLVFAAWAHALPLFRIRDGETAANRFRGCLFHLFVIFMD